MSPNPDLSYLTTDEFVRAQTVVLQSLDSIHAKIDGVSDRVIVVETKLEERTVAASAEDRKATRNTSATWSAAVAGAVLVVVEAVKAWTK